MNTTKKPITTQKQTLGAASSMQSLSAEDLKMIQVKIKQQREIFARNEPTLQFIELE